MSRTGVVCGSSQLVAHEVSIQTHQTAHEQEHHLREAESGEPLQQSVGELRDREHEHEVEEQFDEGLPGCARARVGCAKSSCVRRAAWETTYPGSEETKRVGASSYRGALTAASRIG
jgi:hypothetical protein